MTKQPNFVHGSWQVISTIFRHLREPMRHGRLRRNDFPALRDAPITALTAAERLVFFAAATHNVPAYLERIRSSSSSASPVYTARFCMCGKVSRAPVKPKFTLPA